MSKGKIRFGIIGAVGRGAGYVRALSAHPHTEISAMCDIQEEALKQRASELGLSNIFTSDEAMLDSGTVDAVVIGTPMPLHVRQSIRALERKIHVISEVPAGVSIEECHDLVVAARKSKARYMMAENYCYIPSNVLVREIARAGLFGELYFGEGEYIHELKDLNEVTVWRRRWQTGINGNTYPTHSLGPLLQWFGNQRVVAVSCTGCGRHYRDPRGAHYENEDSTFTFCRLSGGGLVKLRLDMLSNRPHNLAYYSLQGTQGCYEAARGLGDQPKIWLRSRSQKVEWKPLKEFEQEFLPKHWLNPPEEARNAGHWGGDYWEVQDFVSAVLEDRDPPIGIHQAMDMTLPGLASQISIVQGGTWVAVPDSRTW